MFVVVNNTIQYILYISKLKNKLKNINGSCIGHKDEKFVHRKN